MFIICYSWKIVTAMISTVEEILSWTRAIRLSDMQKDKGLAASDTLRIAYSIHCQLQGRSCHLLQAPSQPIWMSASHL